LSEAADRVAVALLAPSVLDFIEVPATGVAVPFSVI
jgi:hypothetical protein